MPLPNTPVIGFLDNRWRRRHVTIHEHPDNPGLCISVGRPYAGGDPIICEEPRTAFARAIAAYPQTVVYE